MGLFTANPITMKAGSVALRVISLGFLASSVSVICSGALGRSGKCDAFTDHFVYQICGCDYSGGHHCQPFYGSGRSMACVLDHGSGDCGVAYVVYRKGVKG